MNQNYDTMPTRTKMNQSTSMRYAPERKAAKPYAEARREKNMQRDRISDFLHSEGANA